MNTNKWSSEHTIYLQPGQQHHDASISASIASSYCLIRDLSNVVNRRENATAMTMWIPQSSYHRVGQCQCSEYEILREHTENNIAFIFIIFSIAADAAAFRYFLRRFLRRLSASCIFEGWYFGTLAAPFSLRPFSGRCFHSFAITPSFCRV